MTLSIASFLVLVVMMMVSISVSSFTTPTSKTTLITSTIPSSSLLSLHMVPKYVGNRWIPQTDDDMPSAGYDIFGTFIRHGPKPTWTRLTSRDDYEQAILKFMVTDKCTYINAQGNMDKYIQNPPDWQYTRMEDIKNGYEKQRDYVTINTQDIILVLVWSTIVIALISRGIYSIINGVDFYDWGFGPFRGSH